MATSTFNKEFKLNNAKEADAFAKAMSVVVSPTLKKTFKSSIKNEKDVRDKLKKALNQNEKSHSFTFARIATKWLL